MLHRLSYFCLIVAVVLVAWAGYLAFSPDPSESSLIVEAPVRDLGERPVGESEIVIRVTNTSRHAREILNTAAG